MCSNYTLLPNNRRLFFGSIPMNKTRDDVWKALLREGVSNIVDVISYKSYSDRHLNRGYVFVEFSSSKEAEKARAKYRDTLKLFGKKVIIDWSNPLIDPEPIEMQLVKKLFIRNLPVTMTRREFMEILTDALSDTSQILKVYKFKDYSFIHFSHRKFAEKALGTLKEYFQNDDVQVMWAKPPSRRRAPWYSLNNNNTEDYPCKYKSLRYIKSPVSSLSCSLSSTSPKGQFSSSPINSTVSASSSASFGIDSPINNDFASLNLNGNNSNTVKKRLSLTEEYPLLQSEPEWVLDFVMNTLKVSLKNKTLQQLIDELDIDFFD